jgi:hypothetical protein
LTTKPPVYREAALKKLTSPEDLDRLLQITNVRAWVFLIALGSILVAALAWGIWGTMTTTVEATGVLTGSDATGNTVVTYVSLADAQQLTEGMPVDVLPYGARLEANGYLRGHVASVAREAATRQQMVTALGSSALIDSFIQAQNLFAVEIALEQNADGSYDWTVADVPDFILPREAPVSVSIIVRREAPISRLFAQIS